MLTRNKKKRTTGKEESCLQNSNQKNSAVPGNHVVEGGEMVTMDHGGTSSSLDDDGERTDYLQVAWLLREKLSDLVDGDKGEFPGFELRSLLDMAASRNIVSVDPKMLNPVLWRSLPRELLLLVLARLPLPDITRLRCLSREWRRDMATVNSEINQACQEVSPPMVALLSSKSEGSSCGYFVTIYDFKNIDRWQYAYHLQLRRLPSPLNDWSERWHRTWTAVDACDGGLVCFISLWKPTKRNRLSFVVVNLLTRVQHELPPPHYLYSTLPAMVQIKVNIDTKCYQVVVVGYKRGGLTIEIYNSGTRQWTRAAPPCSSILGPVYEWKSVNGWYHELSSTPGAYDFVEGKLELFSKSNPSTRESVIDSVLEKDHMFMLQEKTQTDASHCGMGHQDFGITEYYFENRTKDWVQGKSYECPSFQELKVDELYHMHLYACDGFLMLTVYQFGRGDPYFGLLDLSTSEWSNISEISNSEGLPMHGSLLCKAFWNVVP